MPNFVTLTIHIKNKEVFCLNLGLVLVIYLSTSELCLASAAPELW